MVINDLFFLNRNAGYVAGYDYQGTFVGMIMKTNDGGVTWLPQLHKTANILRAVVMTDETSGYVAGDNGTILMTDVGGDYMAVPVIPGSLKVNSLAYPNPCNHGVSIVFNPVIREKYTLEIINTLGRVVIRQTELPGGDDGSSAFVDTDALPAGLYIYRVMSGNRTISGRFIKY